MLAFAGTLITITGAGFERGGLEGLTVAYVGSQLCDVGC